MPDGPPAVAIKLGRDLSGVLLFVRAALVLGAIVVAYHYSLLTLLRSLTLDTPLAYLGLVPAIALLLAVIAGRRWHWAPDVHDRYVDYIVAVPLLVLALVLMVVGPAVVSSFFWRWRLDLLSLPLFVAGAIVLVFGLRTALRVKAAIAFLFLAWPLPYTLFLNDWLQAFTDTTVHVLRQLVQIIHVARPVGGPDASLFFIPDGGKGFVVAVASACAGVNSSLGFLLVGSAVGGVARGGALRKIFWLANGLVLTLALNLARIMIIFAAGNRWGQDFAIGALHPVIGLALFNVGVLVSVLALPAFGLSLEARPPRSLREPRRRASFAPASVGEVRVPRQLPVRRAAIALSIVVACSALSGTADAGLRAFETVAQDLGQPRLGEWSPAIARVDGWTVRQTNSYAWVVQYFGSGATWNRYAYLAETADASSPRTARPAFVNVDVISTWDLGTLSTYGLEACYGFHNYDVLETGRVELGAGVVGHTVAYVDPGTTAAWTAVYWEWPVQAGDRERYERIILNVPSVTGALTPAARSAGDPFGGIQLALASLMGGSSGATADPQLAAVRDFLVDFAQHLVVARAEHAATPGGTAIAVANDGP
jgi:exosortase/archaeosortase family protein